MSVRCAYGLNFHDYESLVRFVRCALWTLTEGAKGRVVTISVKKICRHVMGDRDGNCFAVVYKSVLLNVIEEVVAPCIVSQVSKDGKHELICNATCLRSLLRGNP